MSRLNIGNIVRVRNVLATFFENFETGWYIDNPFVLLFTENFETNWFVDNIFTQLFTENFENGGW